MLCANDCVSFIDYPDTHRPQRSLCWKKVAARQGYAKSLPQLPRNKDGHRWGSEMSWRKCYYTTWHVVRIVVDVSGWMSTTASVYIAEASPAHLRGRLVAFQSVLITMGRFCGAMASAVAFSLHPLVTGRKQPVLMMTTDLLTATKAHQPHFRLQWLDVLNFSSRRSVSIDRCSTFVSVSFIFHSTTATLTRVVLLLLLHVDARTHTYTHSKSLDSIAIRTIFWLISFDLISIDFYDLVRLKWPANLFETCMPSMVECLLFVSDDAFLFEFGPAIRCDQSSGSCSCDALLWNALLSFLLISIRRSFELFIYCSIHFMFSLPFICLNYDFFSVFFI